MSGDLGLSPGFDGDGWPACSPGLRKLLTEGETYSAVRLIVINQTLRAECEGLMPRLEGVTETADPGDLLALLNAKAPKFGVPVAGADFWSAYLHDLARFPLPAVQGAFAAWAKPESHQRHPDMATIFPTPAQLVPFALAHRNALAQMRYRARKAVERVEKAPPKITEAERKEVGKSFAELAQMMKAKQPRDPFAPRLSPHQVAQQLRASASNPVAKSDAAPEDDVGDVL